MKKDKEWLKETVGELNLVDTVFESDGVNYIDTAVSVMQVFDLIDELEEPKKVVIPKFVAEWIEDLKSKKINLLEYIYDFTHEEDINNYIREQDNALMRAWLDGFTVTEEPKYYALIKGYELLKGKGDWVVPTYWCLDTTNGNMFISDRITVRDKFLIETSKSEWNKLGVNEDNADFVKVEKME